LACRIWIDVEDLFKWQTFGRRPSGIQRVEFELCRALVALGKDRVFFVRHDAKRRRLVAVSWEVVERLFDSISSDESKGNVETRPNGGELIVAVIRSVLRNAANKLPLNLRLAVFRQIRFFVNLAQFVIGLFQRPWRPRARSNAVPASPDEPGHGDILAVLGCGWASPDYFSYVENAVCKKGLRFALLIYDIIPLRRPEWFEVGVAEYFRTWFDGAITLADTILTISDATARDVAAYSERDGLNLRAVPTPIPIGTGFATGRPSTIVSPVSIRLPPPNSYALIVSTIEVRKNHLLLFRVWRRLLEDMPVASVPTLVFAGRVGWLVSDLMQELRNCNFLDGKIIHIDSPTDEELETLYDGCLFTLFPSFYEGWGLPVTESHAFGRPCIISNATSLPEAGGELARYIDPDDIMDAYRVIRETIKDRAGLWAWRHRVQREFKRVEWSESAHAVLQALDGAISIGAISDAK
jgi:glycosyltransferase involved in cell wall biosynthesis